MGKKIVILAIFAVAFLVMGPQLFAAESTMSAVDENMRRLQLYMQQTPTSQVAESRVQRSELAVDKVQTDSSLRAKGELLQAIEKVSLTDSEKLEVISLILAR